MLTDEQRKTILGLLEKRAGIADNLGKQVAKGAEKYIGGALEQAGKDSVNFAKSKMFPKSFMKETFGPGGGGRKVLGYGAGVAALGGGVSLADTATEKMSNAVKKRSYYRGMLDDNPALKKENPKDVGRIFNTLFRFNKKMAGDPLVAGSFLKRSLQFKDEGIQPVDVKTLTEVGKHLADSKKGRSSILGDAFKMSPKDLASF